MDDVRSEGSLWELPVSGPEDPERSLAPTHARSSALRRPRADRGSSACLAQEDSSGLHATQARAATQAIYSPDTAPFRPWTGGLADVAMATAEQRQCFPLATVNLTLDRERTGVWFPSLLASSSVCNLNG